MDICIQDLSMTYPNGKQALSNLNLELKAPSMIGLLGPNGAGTVSYTHLTLPTTPYV